MPRKIRYLLRLNLPRGSTLSTLMSSLAALRKRWRRCRKLRLPAKTAECCQVLIGDVEGHQSVGKRILVELRIGSTSETVLMSATRLMWAPVNS